MAVISTLYPTLADIVSRADASGRIDTSIVEMLTETNEMLDDMVFLPANGVTEHVTTVRVGLPSATWRKLNYGVKPSKSKTKKIKDSLGSLEALARVDKALVDLNGNTESFRLSEESAFIEAMTQQMQQAVIYGDSSIDPEKFMGLQARFNDKSAETAANVIDAGGTTARSGNSPPCISFAGDRVRSSVCIRRVRQRASRCATSAKSRRSMMTAANTESLKPTTSGTWACVCAIGVTSSVSRTSTLRI